MRRYHELAVEMYGAILSKKKISKLSFTVDELRPWLYTVDLINGLPYTEMMFGKHMLNQYVIPASFECLLHPMRVSVVGSKQDPDVLDRLEIPENVMVKGSAFTKTGKLEHEQDLPTFINNATEFNELSRLIAGSFHGSVVTLQRPQEVTVAAIRNQAALGDLVYSTATPFIPLPVDESIIGLFGVRHMVDLAEDHLVFSFGEIIGGQGQPKPPSNDFKANDENPNNPL